MKNYRNSILPQQKDSLLVFGSRTLGGKEVNETILNYVNKYDIKYIITAYEPDGVCKCAREILLHKELGITIILIAKDVLRGRGKYNDRSKRAIQAAEKILFIWDGQSRGTKGEIELAKKLGREYTVEIIEPCGEWSAISMEWEK